LTQHAPLPLRDFFPEGGLLICRPAENDREALAVSIKGGHNAEPHNHNDAGSYMVVLNGVALVVDPGQEVYTSRTFSQRRYESEVVNSFGHSVPRIAGQLQSRGASAHARILQADFTDKRDSLRFDLASAYDVRGLQRLERSFIYDRERQGEFQVVDDVAFFRPKSFETALITFAPWHEEAPGRLRIGTGATSVAVEVSTEGSDFRVTAAAIDAELPGGQVPTRLAIELTKPVSTARVTMTFRPWHREVALPDN
jgi:hypothetical protein